MYIKVWMPIMVSIAVLLALSLSTPRTEHRSRNWSYRHDPAGWYVDSVNGNDANSGKSKSMAFKSIAALRTVLRQDGHDGEHIYLAKGSYFEDYIDNATNYLADATATRAQNIAISTYGTGADPIFDASDAVSPAAWTKTGGRTNVYQASLSMTATAPDTAYYWSIWEDGTILTRVANVAAVDATEGSYTSPQTYTSNPDTIYIHPYGSGDPVANGKEYRQTKRRVGIWTSVGSSVDGVVTRRHAHYNGGLRSANASHCTAYGYVNGCTSCHVAWNDGTMLNVTSYGGFISHSSVSAGAVRLYKNCNAYLAPDGTVGTGTAFFAHTSTGMDYDKIVYDGCYVEDFANGYGGGEVGTVVVHDSRTQNVKSAIVVDTNDLWVLGGTYIGFLDDTNYDLFVTNTKSPARVTVRMARFINKKTSVGSVTGNNGTFDVQYSSFYFTDGTIGDRFRGAINGNPSTIAGGTISKHNLFHRTIVNVGQNNAGDTYDADYNLYSATGTQWRIKTAWYYSVPTYLAGGSWDSHYSAEDQTTHFTGDPTAGDLSVDPTSASWTLQAGADVGTTKNCDGNASCLAIWESVKL